VGPLAKLADDLEFADGFGHAMIRVFSRRLNDALR
jgi:hypothetical protein